MEAAAEENGYGGSARYQAADGSNTSTTDRYYVEGERYDWVHDPRRLEKIFHRSRARTIARLYEKHIPRQIRRHGLTLDLGCGTGLVSRQLATDHLVLCDINRWNLEKARDNLWRAGDYVQCSAHALPFVQLFSCVIATEILEHLDQPWAALGQAASILVPGGLLIGSVPSRSLVWKLRRILSSTHPHSEPFHHNYSP